MSEVSELVSVRCLVVQLCLTLCDPMDCSPPGSSVHGIFQAKITGVGCHFLLRVAGLECKSVSPDSRASVITPCFTVSSKGPQVPLLLESHQWACGFILAERACSMERGTFILLWGMVLIQPEQELKSPQVQWPTPFVYGHASVSKQQAERSLHWSFEFNEVGKFMGNSWGNGQQGHYHFTTAYKANLWGKKKGNIPLHLAPILSLWCGQKDAKL